MSAENQEPNKFSTDESGLAENKTLLKQPTTAEQNEEQTLRFEAPDGNSQTNHKTEFETAPTKLFEGEDSDELQTVLDENALKPSRLRFSVLFLLCFLAVVNS